MDIQSLISEFFGSEQGRSAKAALASQGFSGTDAETMLGHGLAAAHDHVQAHAESHGLLGEHAGKSFFAAFASGLIRGDGLLGALEDGGEGVLTGRIAEAIADRAGIDSGTASAVAAAATPFIVSFLRSRLG